MFRTLSHLIALALTVGFIVMASPVNSAESSDSTQLNKDPVFSETDRDPRLLQEQQLENDYWRCIEADDRDVQAKRFPTYNVVYCQKVSQFLQRTRFGNDFGRLHAWTQEHKQKKVSEIRASSIAGGV